MLRKLDENADEETICQHMREYIGCVSESAQNLMDNSQFKAAQKILKGCKKNLLSKIPLRYAYMDGNLFIVNNNLA
jgi:hypothetical protein